MPDFPQDQKASATKLAEADGIYRFHCPFTGWAKVSVGSKRNRNFGSGTVTVQQDGLAFDSLDAITAQASRNCLLQANEVLEFVVSGSLTPSLDLKVSYVRERT
jgi:hypothetical protein